TNRPVGETLGEVRAALSRLRSVLATTLAGAGCRLAATGTHPFSSWREDPEINPEYERLEREYQQLAREQVICGGHVHIGIDDPELAIAVVNHVGPWLSPIVALAANSPFWSGCDTGYASYRTELWRRWPTAGTVVPARELIGRLLERLRPVLVDLGDWDEVAELVGRTLADGTAADRQRRVWAGTGDLRAVVDFIVEATVPA